MEPMEVVGQHGSADPGSMEGVEAGTDLRTDDVTAPFGEQDRHELAGRVVSVQAEDGSEAGGLMLPVAVFVQIAGDDGSPVGVPLQVERAEQAQGAGVQTPAAFVTGGHLEGGDDHHSSDVEHHGVSGHGQGG